MDRFNYIGHIQYLHQETVQWITHMLLEDEIRLKDIPQKLRVSESGIYVVAFRISNKISCKRFIKDLNILCKDIYTLSKNSPYRDDLIHTLDIYLALNDHTEEDEFIDFQKNIYEKVLHELQRNRDAVQENIERQLKDKGIIRRK